MFEEAVERFHQLDDSDIWAGVDELMVGVGSIGPAPRVGERVELRLAHLPARLAKEDVVIGVGVKGGIEINQIDTSVGKFLPIRKPFEIVRRNTADSFRETSRDCSTSLGMTSVRW